MLFFYRTYFIKLALTYTLKKFIIHNIPMKGHFIMDEKKLSDILKDEDFIEEIFTTATPLEVKELFQEKGLELSDKETEKVIEIFEKNIEDADNLSNEELQSISGGTSEEINANLETFLSSDAKILENAKQWEQKIKN